MVPLTLTGEAMQVRRQHWGALRRRKEGAVNLALAQRYVCGDFFLSISYNHNLFVSL